jgi:AraC-like DNA-binding protein
MVDLMLHAADVAAERSPERFDAPVLLSMMLDHIDRHGCDPELDASMLARKFQCSERYVHRLFARTGQSVGEHINDRRITASMRELLDARRKRTIAEIAFASGFRDISHFNRLFKRRNGATPREFRRVMDSGDVGSGTGR